MLILDNGSTDLLGQFSYSTEPTLLTTCNVSIGQLVVLILVADIELF